MIDKETETVEKDQERGQANSWKLCCMEALCSRLEKQEMSQLERKTSTTDRHSAATKGA